MLIYVMGQLNWVFSDGIILFAAIIENNLRNYKNRFCESVSVLSGSSEVFLAGFFVCLYRFPPQLPA